MFDCEFNVLIKHLLVQNILHWRDFLFLRLYNAVQGALQGGDDYLQLIFF